MGEGLNASLQEAAAAHSEGRLAVSGESGSVHAPDAEHFVPDDDRGFDADAAVMWLCIWWRCSNGFDGFTVIVVLVQLVCAHVVTTASGGVEVLHFAQMWRDRATALDNGSSQTTVLWHPGEVVQRWHQQLQTRRPRATSSESPIALVRSVVDLEQ